MYVILAFAVALLVIALAWRGVGVRTPGGDDDSADRPLHQRPSRPDRPGHTRTVAPDDDPEFLSELARKLREENGH